MTRDLDGARCQQWLANTPSYLLPNSRCTSQPSSPECGFRPCRRYCAPEERGSEPRRVRRKRGRCGRRRGRGDLGYGRLRSLRDIGEEARRLRGRQRRDRYALMRRAHEAGPDLDRQSAAHSPLGRRTVVIAEPDAGDEIGGVADEPGVAEILAGSGLARRDPARQFRLARGAAAQRFLHHGVHHRDIVRVDHLAELVGLAGIEQLAMGGTDLQHHMRRDAPATIGERHIGADQFQERYFRGAERDRGIGLELR